LVGLLANRQYEKAVAEVNATVSRRFALAGTVLGFTLMGVYWYDYKFNPFHLPPPPSFYTFLEKAMFVLCPGLLLQVFTIGTSDRIGWTMWVLAALVNGPIYYGVGLISAVLVKKLRGRA
jgi:hypothetical protein